MSTYLITGGAGFIGSTLTDFLLKLGHKVVVIDNFNDYYNPQIKEKNIAKSLSNPLYKLYRNDIRDTQALENIFSTNHFDCIIHLAAMAGVRNSIKYPTLYQDVNCNGTLNILELMNKYNYKNIIIASSSSVYGNSPTVPFSENDIVDFPISPYASTKKATELISHTYHHLYNFNVINLRFFTVYGERQRPDLAISKFTKNIIENKPITLYGDGTTYRDYTYIQDIINGIYSAIQYLDSHTNIYEIINLGSSSPISLKDMVITIEKVLNKKAIINYLPMQSGDVDRTYANISKAKKLLNYSPQTSFENGIKNFINWFKENNSSN